MTEAFLVSGFDEFEILGEDLESTLHFINGIVSLSVSVSETDERYGVARFSDHLK
jgi:type III secretory pathway lipoprotein EscJ